MHTSLNTIINSYYPLYTEGFWYLIKVYIGDNRSYFHSEIYRDIKHATSHGDISSLYSAKIWGEGKDCADGNILTRLLPEDVDLSVNITENSWGCTL